MVICPVWDNFWNFSCVIKSSIPFLYSVKPKVPERSPLYKLPAPVLSSLNNSILPPVVLPNTSNCDANLSFMFPVSNILLPVCDAILPKSKRVLVASLCEVLKLFKASDSSLRSCLIICSFNNISILILF